MPSSTENNYERQKGHASRRIIIDRCTLARESAAALRARQWERGARTTHRHTHTSSSSLNVTRARLDGREKEELRQQWWWWCTIRGATEREKTSPHLALASPHHWRVSGGGKAFPLPVMVRTCTSVWHARRAFARCVASSAACAHLRVCGSGCKAAKSIAR